MNIDYSICQALQYNSQGLKNALLIYDIACQWSRHFEDRVSQSEFLALGDWSTLTAAVGKFHLSAHIPSCFTRFSLNFIPGAGQQDGEILETLWSDFNKVSASARTMSKAHRAEVFDDHMRDSNWKKIVGMGEFKLMVFYLNLKISSSQNPVGSLKRKLKLAEAGLSKTRDALDGLSTSLPNTLIEKWQSQELNASSVRGDALDIYTVQMSKGSYLPFVH
jgi:Kyakuja-Dileera-Zisupton transposase